MQRTTALTNEQTAGEFASEGGSAGVLPRFRPQSVPRATPVLPDTLAFSPGIDELLPRHGVSNATVTHMIESHVAAARTQAAALPEFLRVDACGDQGTASTAYLCTKRVVDVLVCVVLLAVLVPVLVLIGAFVAIEGGGPILYYQTRVGRGGRHFRFYKFRSMVRNADALKDTLAAQNEAVGPVFKMRNDPRITRVGRVLRKTSLDELPQLLNVLRGEMTLVGPRPHLPREVDGYEDWHFERQNAEPGLLCLREVLGRSNLSFDQWVAYDLLYIRNRCAKTDLWILLRLIPAVLKADGAY